MSELSMRADILKLKKDLLEVDERQNTEIAKLGQRVTAIEDSIVDLYSRMAGATVPPVVAPLASVESPKPKRAKKKA